MEKFDDFPQLGRFTLRDEGIFPIAFNMNYDIMLVARFVVFDASS